MHSLLAIALASGLVSQAYAVCQSYGTDFMNEGSYCIDPRLTDVFSFGTDWFGCTADDTQGGVDPYLSDPNGNGEYCSTIQTNPDGQNMVSTCDVDGTPVTKNTMISGNWTVGLYGLTFAYERVFYLNVQIPATVTSTPTLSFTVTSTPSTTVTSTITGTDSVTLPPVTTTVPSTTITYTSTSTPARVTTTSTSTFLITFTNLAFGKTTVTSTSTCSGVNHAQDPTATFTPSVVASSLAAAKSGASRVGRGGRFAAGWGSNKIWGREAQPEPTAAPALAHALAKRTPDPCTITSTVNSTISTTLTSTAPVSTITVPTATTITVTVTPPVVTSVSGKAKTTVTTTLPTPTRTIMKYTIVSTTTTKTILATVTSRVTVAPSGKVCRWNST